MLVATMKKINELSTSKHLWLASARSIFLVLHEFQLNVRSFILLIDATTFCLANISHVKKSSLSKQTTTLHV
jgi:hypothetical protein